MQGQREGITLIGDVGHQLDYVKFIYTRCYIIISKAIFVRHSNGTREDQAKVPKTPKLSNLNYILLFESS